MYPVDGYEAYRMGLYNGPTGTMIDGVDEEPAKSEDREPEEFEETEYHTDQDALHPGGYELI